MLNVAIIGYGLAGALFHAPFIAANPRLRLALVATRRDVDLGDARRVADPYAAVEDPAVDAVVIASPNATHFPLAEAALRAGKHVVVDKPLVISMAQADALLRIADRSDRMLSVFHNRRWDGDFLTVKHLLDTDAVGSPLLFEAHWDRFRPALRQGWKEVSDEGSGLLFDLGPHMIDQMLQLFGMPRAVSADILVQRPGSDIDDCFELRFDFGALRVRLCSSMMIADPRPRFALHGPAGSFVKYGVDTQEDALKAGRRPADPGFGEDIAENFGILTAADGTRTKVPTQRGCYAAFYEAFAAAVLDGASLPVDPRDARDGLRIIDCAREAARAGCWLSLGK